MSRGKHKSLQNRKPKDRGGAGDRALRARMARQRIKQVPTFLPAEQLNNLRDTLYSKILSHMQQSALGFVRTGFKEHEDRREIISESEIITGFLDITFKISNNFLGQRIDKLKRILKWPGDVTPVNRILLRGELYLLEARVKAKKANAPLSRESLQSYIKSNIIKKLVELAIEEKRRIEAEERTRYSALKSNIYLPEGSKSRFH